MRGAEGHREEECGNIEGQVLARDAVHEKFCKDVLSRVSGACCTRAQ